MAGIVRALGIRFRQVLVAYRNDPEVTWHHRLLLARAVGSRWVACTPDLELQLLDVAEEEVCPLQAGRPIPEAQADGCYVFGPLPARELSELVVRAREMASLFAEPEGEAHGDVWVVCSPGHARFGEIVAGELLAGLDRALLRSSLGVVELEDDEATVASVARVPRAELEAWRTRHAGGGDLRLLGTHRDGQGRRFLSFKEGVDLAAETKFDDFPFPEPRATRGYLGGLQFVGGSSENYHNVWLSESGGSPGSVVAHGHKVLLESLRLGMQYDQVNMPKQRHGGTGGATPHTT